MIEPDFFYCWFCDRKSHLKKEIGDHIKNDHRKEFNLLNQAKKLTSFQIAELESTHKQRIETSKRMLTIYHIEMNRRYDQVCEEVEKEKRECSRCHNPLKGQICSHCGMVHGILVIKPFENKEWNDFL